MTGVPFTDGRERGASRPHRIRLAANENDAVRQWVCATCDSMTEPEQSGPHCWACASYWADVRNGLFDD